MFRVFCAAVTICVVTAVMLWGMAAIVPVYAQGGDLISVGLANDRVQITTGFNGSRLTIFGVRRQAGDVAVVVKGPERRMTVRRKGQSLGMWRNVANVRFRNVPSYYDYATSGGERNIAPYMIRHEYDIGVDALDFDALGRYSESEIRTFREALIRNMQVSGHFALEPERIVFLSNDFFRADFDFPADVPTGLYTIETYLLQDGKVQSAAKSSLRIGQVGISARIYRFAYNESLLYGVVAVIFALMAGWMADLFFRKE